MTNISALAITYEGTEEISKNEIEEILSKKAKPKLDKKESTVVRFSAQKEELFKLAYLGQSFVNVIQLIESFDINEFEDIQKVKQLDFTDFKDKQFRVTCMRIGEHSFNSSDIEKEVGGYIIEKANSKVNLDNPESVLFVYIYDNKCYVGIDYNNVDLSKRDYNLHPHSKSIKAPLAFAMIKIGGYEKGKTLLDPFCLSGTIAIEGAYYSTKFPINYFRKNKFLFVKQKLVDDAFFKNIDSDFPSEPQKIFAYDYELRNITASKHNAKIGEVDKCIEFRRVDTEWIDLKFDEESVDLIATCPPNPNPTELKKMKPRISELFHNAEYILKKKGKLVIRDNQLIRDSGERSKLKLSEEISITKGNSVFSILVYVKE